MWIVRLALDRPYTFVVVALMILIMGGVSIWRMAVDIFPDINIPVASVIWSYNGMAPDEIEKRVVTVCERAFTTTVNDIEHIESQSYRGVSVIKIFFQPKAEISTAVAQLTAVCQAILRTLPPGIFPPLIVRYNASNVPILQATLSSDKLTEQEINDYATNFIRTGLATVQGAAIPLPYGGKQRQIMVDLNSEILNAKNLSASDVTNALIAQNVIVPAGTVKIGDKEYDVKLNSAPELVDMLNGLPVKQVNGATVYMKDVAYVHEGFAIQTNVVRYNGKRASFLSVLKIGSASTLDIVDKVKKTLPKVMTTVPPELKVNLLFDQSIFVKASINGVVREGIIAACLTGLMILVFLGSWRSTLVVVTSIPLSILSSIIVMYFLGETLNIMTLGGLALAVGILVDDATVEIENTTRNLMMDKPVIQAILDGANQIALPALVSTLSICIVFIPIFMLSGVAQSLFSPLAIAVVIAMLASYLLSRTLVPVMINYLIHGDLHLYREEQHGEGDSNQNGKKKKTNFIWRIHKSFDKRFEQLREGYKGALEWALGNKAIVIIFFIVFCACSFCFIPFIGKDFFPKVDAGQFRMLVRVQPGTRIEETEILLGKIEDTIRSIIPPAEMGMILDNIGLPNSGINLAYSSSSAIGAFEGEVLVSLKEQTVSTQEYMKKIRLAISKGFPGVIISFPPADIVEQILNFGIPSPVDIQVTGKDQSNYSIARKIANEVALLPGATDVYIPQVIDMPQIRVNVDRTKAEQIGLTQSNVASNVLITLTSSGQSAPNFYLNPKNGVSYNVAVQTPPYKLNTNNDLENIPITAPGLAQPELLSNLATLQRNTTTALVSHYNVQPVIDVFANVEDTDLGSLADGIEKIVKKHEKNLPRGTSLSIRGQVQSMNSSFQGLIIGVLFAIVLVYLLMVMNFQSWLDPFIIILALPGALSGIMWMLFVSQTTFSVPSLMGAIMCIGVATSNSILLVTFGNDEMETGKNAYDAAISAGYTRIRPVVMTALAMIIGMMPMALGFGEGGEQNAPLGRAVIGGLLVATFTTLFFVPVMYSIMKNVEKKQEEKNQHPNDLNK